MDTAVSRVGKSLLTHVRFLLFLGDEKFDVAEVKEAFTFRETLFWSKLKTPWPMRYDALSSYHWLFWILI
jgi:hypothetical protein